MLPRLTIAAAVVAAAALAAPAEARHKDEGIVVQDLAYGEVLFDFFQEDYFDALTRLLAAEQRNEIPHHQSEAELMLGGLYLSYGEHRLAGEIFERVLAKSVDPALNDRCWFFLAKIWHERGYQPEAEAALARITGELPKDLEQQRQMLTAEVLMSQGRFADALAALEAWKKPGDAWVGYAKYNIGVSLVRLGKTEDGARVLDEVGKLEPKTPQLAALRDKANVALGYAWLQASRPVEAKPSLERVRLEGPFSNKALLGVGWSDAETKNYPRRARALARAERAQPARLRRAGVAARGALCVCAARRGQAGGGSLRARPSTRSPPRSTCSRPSIDAIEHGDLITELLGERADDGRRRVGMVLAPRQGARHDREPIPLRAHGEQRIPGGAQELSRPPVSEPQSRALAAEPRRIRRHPRHASARYEQRLPTIDESLGSVDLDAMMSHRVEFESRLQQIERTEDAVALGTEDQQKNWRKLTADGSRARAAAERRRIQRAPRKAALLEGRARMGPAARLQGAALGGEEEPRRSRPAAPRGAAPSS